MRKKTITCVAFLALALMLAAAVALDEAWPALPLRVGMTGEEVDAALHQTNYRTWCRNNKGLEGYRLNNGMWYDIGPDWRGNMACVFVFFDPDNPDGPEVPRVVRWETHTAQASKWAQVKYVLGLK